jgi:hypothetical protein
MSLRDILTIFLTATLSASVVLMVALMLESTLRLSVISGIKTRIHEARSKWDHYYLDWRSSFY